MLKYPKNGFNTFGIYCWHAYITNPKIIELQITDNYQNNNKNLNFKALGIFELEMRPGKQLFSLNYNNIINNTNLKNNIKAIKIIIRETYGGIRTYINQIMFYEQNAEQVKDIICGNELNRIYKNQKKLIQNYSNKQLKNKCTINKNNSFNNIKNRCKISQRNNQKNFTMDYSDEKDIKQCKSQNYKNQNKISYKNNKNDKYFTEKFY